MSYVLRVLLGTESMEKCVFIAIVWSGGCFSFTKRFPQKENGMMSCASQCWHMNVMSCGMYICGFVVAMATLVFT